MSPSIGFLSRLFTTIVCFLYSCCRTHDLCYGNLRNISPFYRLSRYLAPYSTKSCTNCGKWKYNGTSCKRSLRLSNMLRKMVTILKPTGLKWSDLTERPKWPNAWLFNFPSLFIYTEQETNFVWQILFPFFLSAFLKRFNKSRRNDLVMDVTAGLSKRNKLCLVSYSK